jgi:xylan 1,4-beta-xylosidase
MNRYFIFILMILISAIVPHIYAQKNNQFCNPILSGFYPDPSICKVDNDYYLVNSTFSYFPGIPVFHSKDLINWELLGHVMDRSEQLELKGLGISEGIFAPAIRYNKGFFYVTCTFVGGGGNFIVTSKSPSGPWSNPTWISQINGIDPSLFFDDDGKSYILYNSIPPDDKPIYDGHRTIRMYEFDINDLKVTGNERILINGGTDINKKPVWIEGPHIFKKDGFYYLIAAEGGTAGNHSQVVFRSKNIYGPYQSYEKNPILTQRNLDPKRKNAITSTGHADFVQTDTGDWWSVFLGCRPYPPTEEGYYNTGRETFLAPVKWIDGWPVINPDHQEVQYFYPLPISLLKTKYKTSYSGNFIMRDDFNTETLDKNWVFLRTPKEKWYDLDKRKGFLLMNLRPEICSEKVNPGFLGHRQQHMEGSASISLDFSPNSENEKAGLLIFQNENHFYFICKSLEEKRPVIQLCKSSTSTSEKMEILASQKLLEYRSKKGCYLKIESHGNYYSFFYGYDRNKWILLKDSVDARFLSTRVAGGFVGCIYALYATSSGKPTNNSVYYDWFEYEGKDSVYLK